MRNALKEIGIINEELGDLSEIEEWMSHSSLVNENRINLKIDIEDILMAMRKLSSTQQCLIQGYYFEEKSFAEIALESNASINTIYKRHFDALARLRKILHAADINE